MTSELDEAATLDEMGPVDYFVVGFENERMSGEAFPLLLDLVDRGIIRILDLAFIRKEDDGRVTVLSQVDLERMKVLEAVLFEGAASGLLGPEDLEEAARALEPGTSAGVLVYENVWAAPFASAVRRAGGYVAATGRIPMQELVAALDAVEAAESGRLSAVSDDLVSRGQTMSDSGARGPSAPVARGAPPHGPRCGTRWRRATATSSVPSRERAPGRRRLCRRVRRHARRPLGAQPAAVRAADRRVPVPSRSVVPMAGPPR